MTTEATQFTFNDRGVCTNPEIVMVMGKRGHWKSNLEIRLCQAKDGRWYFGYSYNLADGGGGCGAGPGTGEYKSNDAFSGETRDLALQNGARTLFASLSRNRHPHPEYTEAINRLKALLPMDETLGGLFQ